MTQIDKVGAEVRWAPKEVACVWGRPGRGFTGRAPKRPYRHSPVWLTKQLTDALVGLGEGLILGSSNREPEPEFHQNAAVITKMSEGLSPRLLEADT